MALSSLQRSFPKTHGAVYGVVVSRCPRIESGRADLDALNGT